LKRRGFPSVISFPIFSISSTLVKTQYFCETIFAQAGIFPPRRHALMRWVHNPRTQPKPGKMYAFLIDVIGQDERAGQLLAATAPADDTSHRRSMSLLSNPDRDSTALKVVEIDMSTVPTIGKPAYLVV